MTMNWTETGLSQLSARVRDLEQTMAEVIGEVPTIIEVVGRLDDDVTRLVAERTDAQAKARRQERETADLAGAVRRLSTQVAWIERHLRTSGGVRAVDLGQFDPELASLAATALAGREAADGLLSSTTRSALETAVSTHRRAVTGQQEAAQALLAVCAELVGPDPDGTAPRQLRGRYQAIRGEFSEATRAVTASRVQATDAQARLTTDEEERRRCRSAIETGERATAQLLTRLRTRIAEVVGDGALLPAWLTDPLGPMPPADAAGRWMEVAAGLFAYRITYGIDEPDDALGDLPTQAPGHRRRWHDELSSGVRELRR